MGPILTGGNLEEGTLRGAFSADPEAFARAVAELLQDPGRRTALGKAARERVVRDQSWESVVDRVEEILVCVRESSRTRAAAPVPTQLAAIRES